MFEPAVKRPTRISQYFFHKKLNQYVQNSSIIGIMIAKENQIVCDISNCTYNVNVQAIRIMFFVHFCLLQLTKLRPFLKAWTDMTERKQIVLPLEYLQTPQNSPSIVRTEIKGTVGLEDR